MINTAGLVVGKMPPAVPRGCWTAWCQVILLGVSALVIVAERTALLYCVGYYLWNEQMVWAGLTLALFLPGTAVQVLSFRWYHSDGDQRTWHLAVTHILHLGIFKRFWDCMWCVWHMQGGSGELGPAVMRQADVSALRLLEVLLLTLPQTLLQTYVLVATDVGLGSPVALCCALCLLSVSWALVLFSRACCLIRPGHLAMPPAALLCQLLWRAGMLGARVASLTIFARVFGWWVCGVVGFHWLTATFWLVSQQTDICIGPWCWRLFTGMLGVVHVFFFLNVKDGPSRFRMAGFYVVMLLENATLMLAASDFLSEASWDSLTVPTAVLCSFLLGLTSLVLYYRFLHPKSTEISQGLQHQHTPMGGACLEQAESSFSLNDKSLPPHLHPHLHLQHGSSSLSGVPGSLVEHPGSCGVRPDGECRHHHWLLVRLALKTGDPAKIDRAYGAGGAAAAMLDADECCQAALKSGGAGGRHHDDDSTCGAVTTPGSEEKGEETLAPLSDCREEFQSMGGDEEEDSLVVESTLESPGSEFKRSSPEGKSVFGDSPEPYFCPTESSSTLYFSADPQSPSCASNPRLDREHAFGSGSGAERLGGELSPVSIPDGGLRRDPRGLAGRAGPRYTSTPRLDGQGLPEPAVPHLTGPRRQLVLSRRGLHEDGSF